MHMSNVAEPEQLPSCKSKPPPKLDLVAAVLCVPKPMYGNAGLPSKHLTVWANQRAIGCTLERGHEESMAFGLVAWDAHKADRAGHSAATV